MPSLHPNLLKFDANRRQGSLGALLGGAALATLGMVGHQQVVRDKRRETPEPTVTVGDESGRNTLVFPVFGCNTDHMQSALAFERPLGKFATVVRTTLPHVGVSAPAVAQKFVDVRHDRPELRTAGYGHSLGAKFWMMLGLVPGFQEEMGKLDVLILEAPVTRKESVRWGGRMLLDGAAVLEPFYAGANNRYLNEPLYSTAEKRRLIYDEELPDACLENFASQVFVIQAKHDPFVDNAAVQDDVQRIFGNHRVEFIIDDLYRPKVTHWGAAQYPEVAGIILDELSCRPVTEPVAIRPSITLGYQSLVAA